MAIFGRRLHCSFCGKNEKDVENLIAGPSVFICNDCVDICVGIIRENAVQKGQPLDELLPMMTAKMTHLRENTTTEATHGIH